MTLQQLALRQQQLTDEIVRMAEVVGLSNDDLQPVTDGVCDLAAYLSSRPRIMWVLKEPYDEVCDGKPSGGGWSITEDCFVKSDAWANRSWQPIIYATYGILYGKHWAEMDWIRDDRSMADVLKQIAYVNVSKMPALTTSSNSNIAKLYELWRPLLLQQIEAYDPDVIIFGNTFQHFRHDLDCGEPLADYRGMVTAYRKDGRLLLAAFHPNCKKRRENYVDSLVDAVGQLNVES